MLLNELVCGLDEVQAQSHTSKGSADYYGPVLIHCSALHYNQPQDNATLQAK